ncbi:glycerol-3-phosphate 1-O-acyltransferase PlsY [Syntrophomonas erecta]
MKEVALIVVCYLIGSIPFSYIFSRFVGKVDIRSQGSGNVGATNVLRTAGPGIAILSLIGDVFKGIVTAWLGVNSGIPFMIIACPLAAAVGHCYSIFLGFKGGKAVATSAGIIIFFSYQQVLILLAIFIVIVWMFRYVSLGSITVAVVFPVLTVVFDQSWYNIVLSILLAALVIYRHRGNIVRLRKGTEPKLGQ